MLSEDKLKALCDKSRELGDDVYFVSKFVLDNPKFAIWSGSGHPNQHHYGYGVAWLLTLCDNISARMNDADTFDIIKHRKDF